MSQPRFHTLAPLPAVAGGATARYDVGGWFNKGYSFVRDGGAGFTAALQGSVGGTVWTNLVNLNASGEGAIADHYNFVRVNVTVAGALGATTALMIAGKD